MQDKHCHNRPILIRTVRMNPSNPPLVAASILSADFTDIAGSIAKIEAAGADWIHLDVMDGIFVPNLTFGAKMVADVKKRTDLPLDVHLMTSRPEALVSQFSDAGADFLTFHLEATVHTHRLLTRIKDLGVGAGISIVPSTPAAALSEVYELLDLLLVMTVNPGFGGQKLIPSCLDKVCYFDTVRKERGVSFHLEVDGGVNRETAASLRHAGADVLVSGSALFSAENPEREVLAFKGLTQE